MLAFVFMGVRLALPLADLLDVVLWKELLVVHEHVEVLDVRVSVVLLVDQRGFLHLNDLDVGFKVRILGI